MSTETPLFDAALAGIGVTAYYRYPDGWVVRVTLRHEGSVVWTPTDLYEGLTTGEAIDVLVVQMDELAARYGSSSRNG